MKTSHVTYYTIAESKREEGENRTREPEGLGPEPSAFDRFATSPQNKPKRTRRLSRFSRKPLGRIELPTCSLRVNRSATELKRPKEEETPETRVRAQGGDRTHDLQINSLSHYRLCYSSPKKEKNNPGCPLLPGPPRRSRSEYNASILMGRSAPWENRTPFTRKHCVKVEPQQHHKPVVFCMLSDRSTI